MKHFSNIEKMKKGNWVIWDNPMYSGLSLNLDFIYDYNKKLNLNLVTEEPKCEIKDITYSIIEEDEVLKKFQLPNSVLALLGEGEAVV